MTTPKLKATCDRVLAVLPLQYSQAQTIDGIIIPEKTMKQIAESKNPVLELEVLSAGPDCKVVKEGMRVVVNRNACSPIPWNGQEYMVFSEVTVIMAFEPTAEIKDTGVPMPILGSPGKLLSIEEIQAGLAQQAVEEQKMVDDASSTEGAEGAPKPQKKAE